MRRLAGLVLLAPLIAGAVEVPRIPSPYRIPERALQGTIRYRLHVDGAAWPLPSTGEQIVTLLPDGGVDVRVCARGCRPETPASPETLRQYLAPNRWVDSDAAAVRRFARDAAGTGSVDARMRRLTEAVAKTMTGPIEFEGYRSASATLATPGGDCTEAAVLLAAAARAQGIPARVAYGLLYASRFTGVSHAFSPHAWVQAWDGARWRSYDAGIGRFGAGHLLLAVGSGEPAPTARVMAAIARMRIADARAVVSASATPAR